jgi:hypothetical protein
VAETLGWMVTSNGCMEPLSDMVINRRGLLILAGAETCFALAARLDASDSDFWNKKPPANWTSEEIQRLLKESPWAKEITPTYTSLPVPTDRRPWGENPPIGWGSGPKPQRSVKAPYQATIRWESADPVRNAQKTALPAAFGDYHVLGIYFSYATRKDLGSKPVENLQQSAVLLGARPVDAEVVQVHPEIADGFLIGFPKTSTRGVKQLEFSARVGLLALKAKFNTREMLYRGQLAF